MDKRPPADGKQWWWPIVLREIVRTYYHKLNASKHKYQQDQAGHIMADLNKHKVRDLIYELEHEDDSDRDCPRYLLGLLVDDPTGCVKVSDLKKPGISNGYHRHSFTRAATQLRLIRFKRKDEWYYRLPSIAEGDCGD